MATTPVALTFILHPCMIVHVVRAFKIYRLLIILVLDTSYVRAMSRGLGGQRVIEIRTENLVLL